MGSRRSASHTDTAARQVKSQSTPAHRRDRPGGSEITHSGPTKRSLWLAPERLRGDSRGADRVVHAGWACAPRLSALEVWQVEGGSAVALVGRPRAARRGRCCERSRLPDRAPASSRRQAPKGRRRQLDLPPNARRVAGSPGTNRDWAAEQGRLCERRGRKGAELGRVRGRPRHRGVDHDVVPRGPDEEGCIGPSQGAADLLTIRGIAQSLAATPTCLPRDAVRRGRTN
jgi:hypothetical protein